MLMNIHNPPAEGNSSDEQWTTIKPLIVEYYNHHMAYVDKGDRMANSHRTWKWTKKLFFHLLDLAILGIYIIFFSCGGKDISHRDFQLALVEEYAGTCCTRATYRGCYADQQVLKAKSVDWTLLATSIGLFHLVDCSAMCVQLVVQRKK
jgi:hypothetical protein